MSFLDMYVLPRAGRPTITMTNGELARRGPPLAVTEKREMGGRRERENSKQR